MTQHSQRTTDHFFFFVLSFFGLIFVWKSFYAGYNQTIILIQFCLIFIGLSPQVNSSWISHWIITELMKSHSAHKLGRGVFDAVVAYRAHYHTPAYDECECLTNIAGRSIHMAIETKTNYSSGCMNHHSYHFCYPLGVICYCLCTYEFDYVKRLRQFSLTLRMSFRGF